MAIVTILSRATQSAGKTETPSVLISAGAARVIPLRVSPTGGWTVDVTALCELAAEKSVDDGASWTRVSTATFTKGTVGTRGGVTSRPSLAVSIAANETCRLRAALTLGKQMPIGLEMET